MLFVAGLSEESNRALIARSFEAWRAGTGTPYDLLAPNASWTITGQSVAAKTYPTREAFMSEVIRPFNARMRSRLVPAVHHLYADGDTVVAFFDSIAFNDFWDRVQPATGEKADRPNAQ